MKIETAPQRDDESLNDRPHRDPGTSIVNTFTAESSANIGDDAMIEIALHQNSRSEWWLERTLFRDVRVYEDIAPEEDDEDENDVDPEDRWAGEMEREWLSSPRVIAIAAIVPADAVPSAIGNVLLNAYECAGGYMGGGGDWSLAWD